VITATAAPEPQDEPHYATALGSAAMCSGDYATAIGSAAYAD
jgi:hypothetical protein